MDLLTDFQTSTSGTPTPRAPSQAWSLAVVVTVSLGFVMAMLDVTVVNVALATVQQEFHSHLSTLVWIVDAYTLTFASLLLLGGSLADWLGAKQAYLVGLALFVGASALCGMATSTPLLVAARLIQGCGAACFLPSSLTLLTQSFADRKTRTKMVGLWGAFIGAATASGPFVGGILIHQWGWRSIFYLNLPIGSGGLILAATLFQSWPRTARPLDIVSHLFLMMALCGLSFTLIEGPAFGWFASIWIVLSSAVTVVASGLFLIKERLAAYPVIPRELFRNLPFWALNGAGFCLSFVLFGEIFIVSLFLQMARGSDAFAAGIEMLPILGIFAFMNYFSGHFAVLLGSRRIMTIGFGVGTAGAAASALLGGGAPYWQLVVTIAICNAGFALSAPAMIASVMQEVGERHANVGAATLNAVRQVGALCGVATAGVIVSQVPEWAGSMRITFGVFAACLLTAALLVHKGTSRETA